MKVFKFGGSCIKDVEHIEHLKNIVEEYKKEDSLLVVISAMGKTTRALEKVAENFYAGKKSEAIRLFDQIKKQHLEIAKYLLVLNFNACLDNLVDIFTEVEWLLHDKPVRNYDYYYDQIVCVGELLSTTIVSAYLNEKNIENSFFDARDFLRTDNNFRAANVDWDFSAEQIKKNVEPALHKGLVITQGFIGCTRENESTTLGLEGSDYSAAIFANILNAEELILWKTEKGIMNADPAKFPGAVFLEKLNYSEAFQMASYGARIIHPKTILPLKNKNIPLKVKYFYDTSLPGTLINSSIQTDNIFWTAEKEHQVLIYFETFDSDFSSSESLQKLQKILLEENILYTLFFVQTNKIQICMDENEEKIQQLAQKASEFFHVHIEKDFRMITLKNYQEKDVEKYWKNAENNSIIFKEKNIFHALIK